MNRYRPHAALPATAAVLLLALAACSSGSSPSPAGQSDRATASAEESVAASDAPAEPAGEAEVRIAGSTFDPGEITVAAGTEVVFTNEDSFAHTVTEGTDGDAVDDPVVDEEIAGGGEVRVTFDEAGTYDITCEIHPAMQMTVTVEG